MVGHHDLTETRTAHFVAHGRCLMDGSSLLSLFIHSSSAAWSSKGYPELHWFSLLLLLCVTSLLAQTVKRLSTMWETQVQSLGQEDLEKAMATHSSIFAWKIAWTEEPDRLQSMGLQRVGHHWALHFHFHFHYYCRNSLLFVHSPRGNWSLCPELALLQIPLWHHPRGMLPLTETMVYRGMSLHQSSTVIVTSLDSSLLPLRETEALSYCTTSCGCQGNNRARTIPGFLISSHPTYRAVSLGQEPESSATASGRHSWRSKLSPWQPVRLTDGWALF